MKRLASVLLALTCALLLPACGPSECTPDNCRDGCCSADTCIRSQGDDACGVLRNGGICEGCASGSVCHLQRQTCFVGVMRTRVQPVRASILDYDPFDEEDPEWDPDGSPPDVVVEMRCPSTSERSRTETIQSFEPRWSAGSCEVLSSNLLKNSIEISIFDVDDFSFDDEFGTVHYQVTPADLNRGYFEIDIPEVVTGLGFTLTHTYSEH
ncbi:MAG: hypothetical protein EOO71_06020 [Myxococcaceae bacterium]|nr:MAG: hypothetical protein EOO71_06020 [Myxococcaceae bacterium]